ncbi:hypothetical protein [uncultured Sphingomonas sp.]|uniref:hypothetical protein n=1 Tax=uncultured Sphingomonas sp. TaxID=158754 RepID=UPI0035CA06DC
MDLGKYRFEHDPTIAMLPADLAVLLASVVARQSISPTALRHQRAQPRRPHAEHRFAPLHGAFDQRVAARLRRWRQE